MGIVKINVNSSSNEELQETEVHWHNPRSERGLKKYLTVNKHLLPIKLSFFFEFGKEGASYPYIMLFLMGIGLNTAEAGAIAGLRFIGHIIGAPLWGYIADSKQIHQKIFLLLCLLSIVLQCSQPIISVYFGDPKVNVCPSSEGEFESELIVISNSSHIHLPAYEFPNQKRGSSEAGTSRLFYIMLLLNTLISLVDGCSVGFVDTGVMQKQRKLDFNYGYQKVFGAIGFGLFGILTSFAIDHFPFQNVSCYSAIFIVYCVAEIGLIISCWYLFKTADSTGFKRERNTSETKPLTDEESLSLSLSILRIDKICNTKVGKLLLDTVLNFETIFFLFTVLLGGIFITFYFSFSMIFLKELDASNLILGLSLAAASVGGTTAMAITKKIMDFLGGTVPTMSFCFMLIALRYIGVAFITSAWLVLPLNFLNFSGVLLTNAFVEHVKRTCDPAIWTTMYGIMYSLIIGFGYLISNVAGGVLYAKYGGRNMFTGIYIASMSWCIVVGLYGIGRTYIINTKYQKEKDWNNNLL